MMIGTNPTKAVPALLKRLKTTVQTRQDGSSAQDNKKTIESLMHRFPAVKHWNDELLEHFVELDRHHRKIVEGSDFTAIHDELTHIDDLLDKLDDLLHKLDAEPQNNHTDPSSGRLKGQNKNTFQPLSPLAKRIIKGTDDPIMKCLRLSYDFLDQLGGPDLKICLLFLAIFPQNVVLKKRFLIYWWIGEGLLSNEEEGEKKFRELLDLELIIPHRTDKCPRVNRCRIHPWTRYMLIAVAIREKLLHLLDDEIPCFDPTHSRRTCLIADRRRETPIETLRTIFNVNESSLDFPREWLGTFKRLVVLQLGRWQVSPTHHIEVRDESFLTGLKTQKHLKYLSLRGISRITQLPSSIKELVSLEILDLKACHNLETLPSEITSLRKLTHLDVSECYLLESMPKGLDNLTSLQVLKGFIIGNSQIKIEHLSKLEKLERLSIHMGSEAVIQDNEFEKLKHLKEVRCLKISWGVVRKDQFIKKSFSFPPKLEKLDLEGIPYDRMPEWLNPRKLSKLKKLYIKGGALCSLNGQTDGWNVEILLLKYTKNVEIDLLGIQKMFPSLKYVKKVEWKENVEGDSSETSGVEFVDIEWSKES